MRSVSFREFSVKVLSYCTFMTEKVNSQIWLIWGGYCNWNLDLIFYNHTCQNGTFNMTEILPYEKVIISRNYSL